MQASQQANKQASKQANRHRKPASKQEQKQLSKQTRKKAKQRRGEPRVRQRQQVARHQQFCGCPQDSKIVHATYSAPPSGLEQIAKHILFDAVGHMMHAEQREDEEIALMSEVSPNTEAPDVGDTPAPGASSSYGDIGVSATPPAPPPTSHNVAAPPAPVSYTHLTLPTKRIV